MNERTRKRLPERRLRPSSPVRCWLTRRRERPETAPPDDLLSALADPAADWKELAVGYAALPDLPLSPDEQAHAIHLLAQRLGGFRQEKDGLVRFGSWILPLGTLGFAVAFLFSMPLLFGAEHNPEMLLAWLTPSLLPLIGFAGAECWESLRSRAVQRAARTALAGLAEPERIAALTAKAPRRFRLFPQKPTAPQASEPLPHDQVMRRWAARSRTTLPADSHALLASLSAPHLEWTDRVQSFTALRDLTLSPSEQTQATHLMADTIRLTGPIGRPLRRLARVAALAEFAGIATGGVLFALTLLGGLKAADTTLGIQYASLSDVLTLALGNGAFATGLTLFLLTPFLYLGLAFNEPKRLLAVREAAMQSAAQIGGPECIPALYEHLIYDSPLREEARATLEQVLPRVTVDWYGRLPAQVTLVLQEIVGQGNVRLACLALDAIGHAGGGSCLERTAQAAHRYRSKEVRAHAEVTLEILQERRRRESSSATLLRASQSTSAEHLLKPVSAAEPDTSNLLRAVSGQGMQERQP